MQGLKCLCERQHGSIKVWKSTAALRGKVQTDRKHQQQQVSNGQSTIDGV